MRRIPTIDVIRNNNLIQVISLVHDEQDLSTCNLSVVNFSSQTASAILRNVESEVSLLIGVGVRLAPVLRLGESHIHNQVFHSVLPAPHEHFTLDTSRHHGLQSVGFCRDQDLLFTAC